ncbi:MAG: FliI/YscN family ATPase [Chloroflexi bacterium]|nr:FliI/YscN family ATPase [Chloroflexota bacterium]
MISPTTFDSERYLHVLDEMDPLRYEGRVVRVIGLTIEAEGLLSEIGEICLVHSQLGEAAIRAEVVGFTRDRVVLMPLGEMQGIRPGSRVRPTGRNLELRSGRALLGRVLDGLGQPIDSLGPLEGTRKLMLAGRPPDPLARSPIIEVLPTGVRAIDGLLACGKGQRIGLFAGSGVGKSVLMGMIARNIQADVNVIALIGERGREVREFIEHDLGPEGLKRSVVVVSTSDQPALVRVKGAWVATALAEAFRDEGLHVNFMMDSITRFAMAQREIGLAIGEPPAARAYPPSVFALLPRLLERLGTSEKGSITGFYTVLVEADDMNEPISDAVRAILDGHVVLSRDLAAEGHYPAIDILQSISRLMSSVASPAHQAAARRIKEMMAVHANARDLINIGAYVRGTDARIDRAIAAHPKIVGFLRQAPEDQAPFEDTLNRLLRIGNDIEADALRIAA